MEILTEQGDLGMRQNNEVGSVASCPDSGRQI